jgi:hypothetical protein
MFAGCKLPGARDKYDRTPNGWHVRWKDQGTESTGLHTKAEILALFDSAMERAIPWCANYVGLDVGYVRSTIKKRDALYTLHDDSIFPAPLGSEDAPTQVWCSGLTWGRSFTEVAFYLWVSVDPAAVPVDAPVWTIHQNPNHADKTIYGVEQAGNEFPALQYELHWQFTERP